ncbi:hypothetical protein D3C81_1425730 [compost metagenome]
MDDRVDQREARGNDDQTENEAAVKSEGRNMLHIFIFFLAEQTGDEGAPAYTDQVA